MASSQNVTDVRCRTERGVTLSLDVYKIDTCARCYTYLPLFAFVSVERKLRYNPRNGRLYDLLNNVSFVADPDNTSHPIYDTFQSDLFARKWIHCCREALQCCEKMNADPHPVGDEIYCPRTWDGWQCWPDTLAGEVAESPCQDHVYFMSEPPPCTRYAVKQCWDNGTWYINQWNNEWSNYSGCGRVEGIRRLQTFHIATYGVSIFLLLPALLLFSTYKQLQVHRITMHKNLFAALLLNAALTIAFKAVVILDEMDHSGDRRTILEENWAGCKLLYIMTKYFRMCTYMWMFCEGFYLHKLIAAAFAEQKSLYMFYFIGWVFPIFPVGTFAILRWYFADEQFALNGKWTNWGEFDENGRYSVCFSQPMAIPSMGSSTETEPVLPEPATVAFNRGLRNAPVLTNMTYPACDITWRGRLRTERFCRGLRNDRIFRPRQNGHYPPDVTLSHHMTFNNTQQELTVKLNLAFLCNIIRVLVTKLRATHANEPSQYRKAVRATLVLVPLFGLHFFLVIYRPQSGECSLLEGYTYLSYAMDGLQGLLVSLIFCYLNGEVTELIRRSLYRFRLRYSLDVHPTSITTASELSSGTRGRHSSDYCGEWKSRRSGQSNFSGREVAEMNPLDETNQMPKMDSNKTAETSLIVFE